MRKLITVLFVTAILFSCSDKKTNDPKTIKIPVVIKMDNGSRQLGILYREIKGKDTFYYSLEERRVGVMDSIGRPKTDTSGKYITDIATQRIDVKKENVIADFSLGIDSLLSVKDTPKQ